MKDETLIKFLRNLIIEWREGFPLTKWELKFANDVVRYTWKDKELHGKQREISLDLYKKYNKFL